VSKLIPYSDFGGDGPLLHFGHANGYPPGCYRQLLERFTARYHVIAMHGRPLWSQEPVTALEDLHFVGRDLVQFCDQQGIRNVIGVGHSLGALGTLYAAVERPDLCHTVALIEPIFLPPAILNVLHLKPDIALKKRDGFMASKKWPSIERTLKRRQRWPSRQAAFDQLRSKSVFAGMSDAALSDYVNYALEEREAGEVALAYPREWEAAAYSAPPLDVWEDVPQLTQPTLAVHAAESGTLLPPA